MATITSTTTGGAFSSGASWVGGIAPGSTDSVIVAASSGTITMDAHFTTTGTVTLTSGAFSTSASNYNLTCSSFASSNSNTRTLTLGSSTITLTGAGATVWDTSTATNLTLNAGTSTITASGAGPTLLFGSGLTFGSLTLSGSGTAQIVSGGSATFANITRAGTASKTDALSVTASPTVTGTFTVTGNSATNRVLVQSTTTGTARTVTAAAVSLANADFADITGAGAASWTGTSLGDCGGNAGITFSPATTRYAVAAGNWSSTAVWSASSGGSAGASVPLPQDNAVLNASSGVGTITVDMPRACKDLTCTGYTGTVSCAITSTVFGSIALASGMTWSHTSILQAAGRGTHVITSAGKSLCGQLNVLAVGGSYSLADALTIYSWGSGVQVLSGTLATNGFSIAASILQPSSGATVNLGASTVTLSGSSGLPLNVSPGSALNAGTSTIVLADTSASTKTFAGGGKVYNNLVIQGGALNSVVITGANTFNNVSAPAGTVLTLPASTTTTATGTVDLTGTRYNGLRLPGVSGNYISTPDAAALRITGDLEIVVRASAVDWTPIGGAGGTAQLIAKRSGSEAWSLGVLAGGAMQVVYRDPTNTATRAYSVNLGSLADGATYWIKITRNATTGTISSYVVADQATEPASWGAAIGTAASTVETIYAGTAPLEIGSRGAGTVDPWTGTMYRAIVRNGIGGTTVFDADFTSKPWGADTFTCTTGQTVTINGDLAKAGDGRVMLVSSTPGTAATLSKASGVVNGDYLAVRDVTATGGATFNAGVRSTLSNATGWNATGTLNKVATFTLGLAPRAFVSKSVGVAALFPLGLMPRDAATAGAARPITWQRLDVGANA